MARSPEELSIRTWLIAATGLAVVFAQQAAPRPARPYATVHVLSDSGSRTTQTTTDEVLGAAYKVVSETPRTGTVSLQVYGNGARGYLKKIPHALRDQAVRDTIGPQTVVLSHPLNAIANDTEALDTGWEERANQDWLFRYIDVVDIEGEVIETVTTTDAVS